MLIDIIKKDNIQAMKDRDALKRGIYTIIITKYNNLEIENKSKGKEVSDADMLSIIQKTLKELEDERAGHASLGREEKVKELDIQRDLISSYLPKQLSAEEIKTIILTQSLTTIPDIMKYFKTNYSGQVDMSLVSKIARGA